MKRFRGQGIAMHDQRCLTQALLHVAAGDFLAEIGNLTQLERINLSLNRLRGECWLVGRSRMSGSASDTNVKLSLSRSSSSTGRGAVLGEGAVSY